jgi:hypothetical protein
MQTLSTIFKHYGPHVNPIDHLGVWKGVGVVQEGLEPYESGDWPLDHEAALTPRLTARMTPQAQKAQKQIWTPKVMCLVCTFFAKREYAESLRLWTKIYVMSTFADTWTSTYCVLIALGAFDVLLVFEGSRMGENWQYDDSYFFYSYALPNFTVKSKR